MWTRIANLRSFRSISCSFFLLLVIPGVSAWGADLTDTKLLAQPAVSKSQIAFVYAGDLWVANLDGKNVRRLTTDEGVESYPAFSPAISFCLSALNSLFNSSFFCARRKVSR